MAAVSTFAQILLINLAVSCDNVGVIALATRDLPQGKAVLARRIGVWLSVLLKVLFLFILGFLFGVPWLHIRIVGGVLLLYITHNMLRGGGEGAKGPHLGGQNSFLMAIASIAAVDLGMSLDNVIAILSIVCEDGQAPTTGELLLIFGALLACVPLLLWFSGAISRLMERYAALTCLCGGYLVYLALNMIFEDELLQFFFEHIQFTLTQPVAVLFGLIAALYGWAARGSTQVARRRSGLLAVCIFVTAYSLISLAAISYLNTHPVVDGRVLSVELLYEFEPLGANAVYAIRSAAELPALCIAVYTGMLAEENQHSYRGLLLSVLKGMLVFLGLELAITTFGLTFSFGFGSIRMLHYASALVLQIALMAAYAAVFCAMGVHTGSKAPCIALGCLFALSEDILASVLLHLPGGSWIAALLPGYYLVLLPDNAGSLSFFLRGMFTASLWAACAAWAGTWRPTPYRRARAAAKKYGGFIPL